MTINQRKNAIYSLLLVAAVYAVWLYRTKMPNEEPRQVELSGQTMGTFYQIKYLHPEAQNFQAAIDALLVEVNQSLSTYIPDSELSIFNQSTRYAYQSRYFLPVLENSATVWEATNGAFDPTIGPLVNVYGFGPEGRNIPDEEEIARLLQSVGFEKIFFDDEAVCKLQEGVYLDFSANAKGYGVDIIAEFLEEQGVQHYMVNIGGDLRSKGFNNQGERWSLGIEKPELGGASGEIVAIIRLTDESMATSGNYRNFYQENGQLFYHTIDPRTGKPAGGNILSSTVIAATCMDADAYATAFMVMGFDEAKAFLDKRPDLKVFFVYADTEGELKHYYSAGINIELIQPKL